jgi:glutathione S-transferase
VRFAALVGRPCDDSVVKESKALFQLMDNELAAQPFLAAATPTIADLALYAYTAHAPEGGISLEPYLNVRAWLARIEALPRFIGMQRSPVAAAGSASAA